MNPMRLILFFICAATAFGQDSKPPTREVHLRLLAFDNETAPAESYTFDPAATQPVSGIAAPIKGYLNHEGVVLKLYGNDVVFSKSGKAEDAKKADLQLGKVTLPQSGSYFMLIFLPAGKETFRILALDDSVKEFPLGSYRVISLSRLPVKITLEDKPYEFKPGQSSLITNPPVQANQHSAMYAFAEVDGKWQRIGSGLWPNPGLKRSVQLFFDNPETMQTELRGFRDIAPPVPGAANAAGTDSAQTP
ncbi:MAG: hypothetical protein ABIT37_25000 [Luteolibacter sp.]